MPATRTLVSVQEYLTSVYQPDCDYVDGQLEERNLGELDHSWLQGALTAYLFARRKVWKITVLPEQRVQVKSTRYRVPDICVVLGPKPDEQILSKPPFICIEILSPEDRMSRVRKRLQDFIDMGVAYVWILDPVERRAFTITAADGFQEVKDGILKTLDPAIEVPLGEIFSD